MNLTIQSNGLLKRTFHIFSDGKSIATLERKGILRDSAILSSAIINKKWKIEDSAILKPNYRIIDVQSNTFLGTFQTDTITSYTGKLDLSDKDQYLLKQDNSDNTKFYWVDQKGRQFICYQIGKFRKKWGIPYFDSSANASLPDNPTEKETLIFLIGLYVLLMKVSLKNALYAS